MKQVATYIAVAVLTGLSSLVATSGAVANDMWPSYYGGTLVADSGAGAGVFSLVATETGRQAGAFLENAGGDSKFCSIGCTLPGGLRIVEISADGIEVSRNGQEKFFVPLGNPVDASGRAPTQAPAWGATDAWGFPVDNNNAMAQFDPTALNQGEPPQLLPNF